jgi:tetratricopeptide (TPR) repeat protein
MYNEAIDCYNRAVAIDPLYKDAYFIKGLILNIQAKHNEALICFNKVLEIDFKNMEAQKHKESTLKELGLLDDPIYITGTYITNINYG